MTKEQFLSASGRTREWVSIPGLTPAGETYDPDKHGMWVGTMSARDHEACSQKIAKGNDTDVRATIAAFSCQTPDGSRMFDVADIPKLSEMATPIMAAIAKVSLRLNSMNAEAHEQLLKNLPAGQTEDSSSS